MARHTSPMWAERESNVPLVLFMLAQIGAAVLTFLSYTGRLGLFLGQGLALIFIPPLKIKRIIRQVHFIGARSLLVVALTGVFTGMVLGLQGYYTLARFGSEAFLGPAVALSLITELGPVLTALMVTGRAGSAIAAEIGIMRITEQIDALEVMALNPVRYLVVPNIVAGVFVLPLLSALFSVIGIYGGYLVGVELLGVNSGTYFGSMRDVVAMSDVLNGLYKSLSFGLLIAFLCCFKGYHTSFGAEGVSQATTEAVVFSSVTVLVLDYFLKLGAPVMSDNPIIQVHDLRKCFGRHVVLNGLSLDIMRGEILAVIGRSGTGKSVFLKHLIGLVRPDRGQVLVDGEDMHQGGSRRLARIRERFGMLFQGGALFDSLTVEDNIAFPLREKTRLSEAQIRDMVTEMLKGVGLEDMEGKFPDQLSGGMRKRVALARALVTHPEIVLFDEPTTGLDPILVRAIHQLIADTQARFHYTAVIVSHEIPQIFEIVTRVAMLHNGAILAVDTADLFQRSSNPAVQQFIAGRLEGPLTST